jgi:CDP-diacylglycerol--glycerol-3-phosphate 3-phosphatidyltransferase
LEKVDTTQKITFSDRMRIWFKWFLDPAAAFFNRIGLTPNTMTLLGLAGNFVGAYFVSQGRMTTGGLFMLITTPLDALDGTMARLRGDASDWGAFVDSVTDRYSELAILGGLLIYFSSIGDALSSAVTFAAAAGTVLVSYVKVWFIAIFANFTALQRIFYVRAQAHARGKSNLSK